MGSKNGKYTVENEGLNRNGNKTSSPLPSNLDRSTVGEKSSKEQTSLPTLIHQESLTDTSSSNMNNVTLVWLDTELNNRPSNIDTQIKLKNIIHYLRTFVEVDECEQYIEQIGAMNSTEPLNEEKLLLIISPILALTTVPRFHDLPQVKYIYVYGTGKINSKLSQQVLIKYTKVKGIFSTSRNLLAQITQDQN